MPNRDREPVNQLKTATRLPRLPLKQSKASPSRLKAPMGARREPVNQSRIKV